MYLKLSFILITVLLWGTQANAQPVTHVYFGVGGFKTHFERESIAVRDDFFDGTLTTTLAAGDDSDSGWQLVYGYQFRKHWGIEAHFFDAGKYQQDGPRQIDDVTFLFQSGTDEEFTAPLSFGGSASKTTRVRGITVLGAAVWPVTQSFSLKAKLGFSFLSTRSDVQLTSVITEQDLGDLPAEPVATRTSFEQNESDLPIVYGLEASFKVGWDWGIAAFWHRMVDVNSGDLSDTADIDITGVQVTFNY